MTARGGYRVCSDFPFATIYYDILGWQPGASKAEMKEAYRRLRQECHPDQLPPDTPKKARQIVVSRFLLGFPF
ncbi:MULTISPECIES: DnaJ domain-containing protein [unclassified Thermosynechococcus]|uniref:DnaJ domain-containing protein n=1 Tax=unclassified Thermosynechococcus TaxID=2622553 RepID=UPI0019E9829D|nr:DnaJ domain-containing protein [Thermosynechococcus sp. M98_K2018_005]HIK48557.1 DnaJ domain-containing protein [Thermosynechococcus sp. M55_K2018_012]